MFKLFIVLAFVPAILARTPFRSCGAGIPVPNAVFFGSRETPCLAEPCSISRSGISGVTYVDFTTQSAATAIRPQVRGTVIGVTVTQDLPEAIQRDPCSILTLGSCPLGANQVASYRLELPIESNTPLVSPETEVTLFGNGNEIIFCYRLATRVVR